MSTRTQRTTKYMFAVAAQLSENFIFIYLGLNLFTQDAQVFKPLFILVTAIAVMASRYAAVFPLSELINWIFHTRGQRYEELPHSYQMMLFWAGLRGAVGVALAAGITGDNADALRTTILVVVVLTVIVFGGTTARMLEVLGIRVGVEDEDGSSDDEAVNWGAPQSGNLALQMDPGSRRYASADGRHNPYGDDYDDYNNSYISSPIDSPAYNSSGLQLDRHPSQVAPRFGPRRASAASGYGYGHTQRDTQSAGLGGRTEFFNNPAESDDDEPLRSATDLERFDQGAQELSGESDHTGMVFRDGQWFKDLDQRYLLPLFSNSVASRKHEIRRASRRANSVYNGGDSGQNTPREPSMDWGAREDVVGPDGKQTSRNFRFTDEYTCASESVTDFFFARPEGQATPAAASEAALASDPAAVSATPAEGTNIPNSTSSAIGDPNTPTTATATDFGSASEPRGLGSIGEMMVGDDGRTIEVVNLSGQSATAKDRRD
ncbi:hypothetical protein QFC21_001816 [Naganishia friedmannii]|uniref:Uncharacterized protein n=1 Tax=Naganishia friedmannii TaxID=89922 RepID=A0ACC2W132_9TREE|nr:hypothetical protein QFC21_001816 [Naganishia friedmannii]